VSFVNRMTYHAKATFMGELQRRRKLQPLQVGGAERCERDQEASQSVQ
jgi:hypothetical protein